MPPRKRPRRSTTPHSPAPHSPTSPTSPPHSPSNSANLVSFLTSYEERDGSSSGSDEASSASDPDLDDPDDDGDGGSRTPSRRGLVGTPGSRKRRTPASTPRRRPTTPSKSSARSSPAVGFGTPGGNEGDGFVRATRADNYFVSSSRAAHTSGSSYSALARPLSQAEYESAANGARRKQSSTEAALSSAARHFGQWAAELEAGFNLLLYGYGSKRRLVNRFATEHLAQEGHVVVVNGHFPQLTIRDVLSSIEDSIALDRHLPDTSLPGATPVDRAAHRLYANFSSTRKGPSLFLILHNIDAPSLRAPKALSALALLASAPRIHVVATYDHVHTPLLFSSAQTTAPPHPPHPGTNTGIPASRGFNWVYHNTTTYDDYDVELAYARLSAKTLSLGTSRGGVSEEGALQILRSVPPMAARLLKLILSRQLSSLGESDSDGTAYTSATTAPAFALDIDLLQKTARDRFIAREEDRFNALLGEFRDHGLVLVAELDGEGRAGRWGWVPLGRGAVERILEEMRDVEV